MSAIIKIRIGMEVHTIPEWCSHFNIKRPDMVYVRMREHKETPHVALMMVLRKHGIVIDSSLFETVQENVRVIFKKVDIETMEREAGIYTWYVPVSSSAGYYKQAYLTAEKLKDVRKYGVGLRKVEEVREENEQGFMA